MDLKIFIKQSFIFYCFKTSHGDIFKINFIFKFMFLLSFMRFSSKNLLENLNLGLGDELEGRSFCRYLIIKFSMLKCPCTQNLILFGKIFSTRHCFLHFFLGDMSSLFPLCLPLNLDLMVVS